MENASKALLMAAGVLIGVLILTLMVTLFMSSKDFSKQYDETKNSEAIQQFNVNFTKYLGQDLTIHQVVSICNFTKIENNKITNVDIEGTKKYSAIDIKNDIESASDKLRIWTDYYNIEVIYKLNVLKYNEETGYISKISISNKKFKCYKKDSETGEIVIVYKS